MKIIAIIITISIAIYTPSKSFAQHTDHFKKIAINTFLPTDSIIDVEIYNSWKNRKYHLTKHGLSTLKNILNSATAVQALISKPGHLYMKIKFKNPNTLKSYEIYMYPTGIFLDPDYLIKKPFYSITLEKPINWNNLNSY